MRIVAGTAKGRRLTVPTGRETRPTADRVREALFSILGTRVLQAVVLDLFAGSGALACEALSRGASRAVLVDNGRSALQAIRANVAALQLEPRARVLAMEAKAALRLLTREHARFDLVLLDPPYGSAELDRALCTLACGPLLANDALIVIEHNAAQAIVLPKPLQLASTRRYGDTAIAIAHAGCDTRPAEHEDDT